MKYEAAHSELQRLRYHPALEGSTALERLHQLQQREEQCLQAIDSERSKAVFRTLVNEAYMRNELSDREEKRQQEFQELARAMPDQISERHYSTIAGRLGDAGNFGEAVALLEAGKETYPESGLLDSLGKKLAEQAQKAGDSDALSALAGLGYVGD